MASGLYWVSYTWSVSTCSFLSFDTKFKPSISKNCFLGLGAVLGLCLAPLEVAHAGVLGPLHSGSLHHAASFPFRGFNTKFDPSFSKTLGFKV